jgi:hypothetical protein
VDCWPAVAMCWQPACGGSQRSWAPRCPTCKVCPLPAEPLVAAALCHPYHDVLAVPPQHTLCGLPAGTRGFEKPRHQLLKMPWARSSPAYSAASQGLAAVSAALSCRPTRCTTS